jgi:acyl-CoA dehydrogenase
MDLMCRHVAIREAFGSTLGEKQTVQNWIADSRAEMDAARLMTLHAAWKMEQKLDARVEISLIKFFGAKVLHDVIDRAIQAHGAMGFSAETPLEMFYREARAARIYDGPDEVHRMVVARRILRQYR